MNYPLFPLGTVLFPGCVLDLQIFEARYLDMVSTCMRRGEGFGVVGILEGQEAGEAARRFSALGCEALIRDFQQFSGLAPAAFARSAQPDPGSVVVR